MERAYPEEEDLQQGKMVLEVVMEYFFSVTPRFDGCKINCLEELYLMLFF